MSLYHPVQKGSVLKRSVLQTYSSSFKTSWSGMEMRAEARLWRRCESTLLLMDEDQLHLQSMASSKSKKCSGLLRRTLFMTPRDSSAEPSTTSITISPQIRFFMEGSFATWTATPPPILCPITMIGVFLFVFTSGRR